MGTIVSIEQEALASPSVIMDSIEYGVLFGSKTRWNQGEVLAIIDAMRKPVRDSLRHHQQATDDALLDVWMGEAQPVTVHLQMERTDETNSLRNRLFAVTVVLLTYVALTAPTLYFAFRQG